MKAIEKIMHSLNAAPKLRLARKLEKGGTELLGPKRVRVMAEPESVMGKDPETGKPRQELKFTVEFEGRPYRWHVPVVSKGDPSQPHYIVERLSELNVQTGDELILEMKRRGPQAYVEIKLVAQGEVEDESDDSYEDGPVA
jgi:hypothetical protein